MVVKLHECGLMRMRNLDAERVRCCRFEMALFLLALFLVASVQVSFSTPYNVTLSDVQDNAIVLSWKTTENSSMIEGFKVSCNGTRRYLSTDSQDRLDTAVVTGYAPLGRDHILIENLKPNFNYSCTLWEFIGSEREARHILASEPVHFTTDYGDPEKPEVPKVYNHLGDEYSKIIKLYSSSTRFGPISGYQVQFHLIDRTTNAIPLISTDDELVKPFSPSSPLVSKNVAQQQSEAQSFWLDFNDGVLPRYIEVSEDLVDGALKRGQEYTVVTVPYTLQKRNNESFVLYTTSKPSVIFTTYTPHSNSEHFNSSEQKSQSTRATLIALLVSLVILVIAIFSFLGIAVWYALRRKKKNRKKILSKRRINENALPKEDINENCDSLEAADNEQCQMKSTLSLSGLPLSISAPQLEMTDDIHHVRTIVEPSNNVWIVMEPDEVMNAHTPMAVERHMQPVQGEDIEDDDDPYDSESYV